MRESYEYIGTSVFTRIGDAAINQPGTVKNIADSDMRNKDQRVETDKDKDLRLEMDKLTVITEGIKKCIITGTPGIGKSLFMVYLLWKLLNGGKRVLFIYHPNTIYYDGRGNVYEVTTMPSVTDHDFWSDDLWCLFDAKEKTKIDLANLPYPTCTFVLSMSPRRDMINDFKKPPEAQKFYMPLWSEKELETVSMYFPAARDWRERFQILGGIPRYVLEVTSNAPQAILNGACKEVDLNDCIKVIGLESEFTEKTKASHSLVHINSELPFTESSVAFASKTALDIIVEKKGAEAKLRIRELLAACDGNPLTAALCGYIFEPYCMELLEKGGRFSSRKLVDGRTKDKPLPTNIEIPASNRITAEKVMRNQIANQLYIPTTKNYTGIDAWIPGFGAFQMTVGKKHDIKSQTKGDLAKLGPGADKLYWLLPPIYFSSFTKKTPQVIDQYAVLIPNPDEL